MKVKACWTNNSSFVPLLIKFLLEKCVIRNREHPAIYVPQCMLQNMACLRFKTVNFFFCQAIENLHYPNPKRTQSQWVSNFSPKNLSTTSQHHMLPYNHWIKLSSQKVNLMIQNNSLILLLMSLTCRKITSNVINARKCMK